MRVLNITWGYRERPRIEVQGSNLNITPVNSKRLSEQEVEAAKEFRPDRIILLSIQDGGIGPSRKLKYATIWKVDYDTGKFHFHDNAFHSGIGTEPFPQ